MNKIDTLRPRRKNLYEQVIDYVIQQIAENVYQVNTTLPSEWELAAFLGVSQGTVRKGLDDLVRQGILVRQQGVGTFVARNNPEWGDLYLQSNSAIQKMPQIPRAESLGVSAVHATEEVAENLAVKRNTIVWKHLVLWRQGASVVALDEAYLQYDALRDLNVLQAASRHDLYHLLWLKYGIRLHCVQSFLGMAYLDREVGHLLKIDLHKPVLQLMRLSHSQYDEVIEWRKRYVITGQYLLGVK